MLLIQGKLVSTEILSKEFVCNLHACKGACCWEGEYGAPLEAEEIEILNHILPELQPFLSKEGIKAIADKGSCTFYEDAGFWGTTLVDHKACAFMTTDPIGIAQCGIEMAWKAGKIDFRKPISCHLYPIRVRLNEIIDFEALNFDSWDICTAACTLGHSLKIPVYQFCKDAIVRKYGMDFYEELHSAAKHLEENSGKP